MPRHRTAILLLISCLAGGVARADAPPTLRVDFYHSGNALIELFSLHQVVIEPTPWPGNPRRPLDDTNRGKYFFEVSDPISEKVLYSRGFNSIYGEWETTGEARRTNQTFHESLRFPRPDRPVRIRVSKRDDRNVFSTVWTVDIDPEDMLVERAHPLPYAPLLTIERNGDPADKVDLLILGDGYTVHEEGRFRNDVQRLIEGLFAVSPFRERRRDFNVWALMPPSRESGVARPSNGTFHWSPLGTRYDAFRSERYVLTFDNEVFREIASFAPYDVVEILVNNDTYGGGGIFGLYSTAAAGSDWAEYLFIHEFGHHFAGLADEYYTSPVAYESAGERPEPWEPNVTALHDQSKLKWGEDVPRNTPIPTPWPKQEYEEYSRDYQARRAALRAENRPEAEMNALFREYQTHVGKLFEHEPYHGTLGAFEGANYEASGYFRPAMNCLMFTRHTAFCPVCADAIDTIIDLYTD